jgi:hypothetical protein
MQAAKRQGRHMGRVSALPQNTGDRLLTLRATHTLAETAVQLNSEGLTSATDAPWVANTVAKAQKRFGSPSEKTANLSHSGCRPGMVESPQMGVRRPS